jgi:hypothetical protein
VPSLIAGEIGLDVGRFAERLRQRTYAPRVARQRESFNRSRLLRPNIG